MTTGFDRPNLFFSVLRPAKKDDKLVELLRERKESLELSIAQHAKRLKVFAIFLSKKAFQQHAITQA